MTMAAGRETDAAQIVPQLSEDLLMKLYRGPLEEVPWRGFLQALIAEIGCDNAAISLQLSRKGLASVTIWGETPPVAREMARDIGTIHAEMGDMDPMSNALKRTGEVMLLEEVATPEGLEQDEFFLAVMKPYGIHQALGMYVSEPGGLECNLGLTQRGEGFQFTAEHKVFMTRLRPHVAQALQLFSRIQRDESEIEILTDTLDRLTIATFILDGRGKLLRANNAATTMIDRNETFRLAQDRLKIDGRVDARRFAEVIDQAIAARLDEPGETFVRAFRCAEPANEGRGVLIRSIRRERHVSVDASPAVVVYATDPAPATSFEQLIATLFDLTPSEAGLAALLTQGFSLSEAAAEAGLTESTVRSYSKRIFAKMGVSRQAELIRLILRSVAILG
ncbi:helix-turn-helix transcriptional regulator [Sphingosinithalassobacter portus]|uniref:helix-turn-helix transcriptional regulator n=1 Tax=Stakelama portus TaxID=2676234 RepID=UPI000D6E6948|nr:LuxR family transcriptional regulator [Sphingosinithalassobacter portus]